MQGVPKDHEVDRQQRAMFFLAMANAGIWVIAMIAFVVLLRGDGNLRGLYPILGGGTAVAVALLSALSKSK